jgi:hypothetical protein
MLTITLIALVLAVVLSLNYTRRPELDTRTAEDIILIGRSAVRRAARIPTWELRELLVSQWCIYLKVLDGIVYLNQQARNHFLGGLHSNITELRAALRSRVEYPALQLERQRVAEEEALYDVRCAELSIGATQGEWLWAA